MLLVFVVNVHLAKLDLCESLVHFASDRATSNYE
jgi:hypothetical protein